MKTMGLRYEYLVPRKRKRVRDHAECLAVHTVMVGRPVGRQTEADRAAIAAFLARVPSK